MSGVDKSWCCEVRYGWIENRRLEHDYGTFQWGMWDRLGVQGEYVGTLEQMIRRMKVHQKNTRTWDAPQSDVQYRVRNIVTQEVVPGEALFSD